MSRRYGNSSSNNNNNSRHPPRQEWVSGTNPAAATAAAPSSATHKKSFNTVKKFVPKNQNPNTAPTLSNSLRQSFPNHSDDSAALPSTHNSYAPNSSRVRMGDGGQWVPSRAAAAPVGGGGSGAAQSSGNFVSYLPQDEAVASGLGAENGGLDPVESQRVVDLLNRDLSQLLKLSPREFWKQVARDTSLHEFLDSFLKFRSRWYDFPHRGAKGIVAGVIVGEVELCRRVFMLLYRISSNKDPGARSADSCSSKDHAALLQEKKLLNLPKLLDVCAIYGHENEELTGLLIKNAITVQPGIHDDLIAVLSHFLGIIHTMHQRCSSSLEVLLASGSHEDLGSSSLLNDLLEVMDFINDAVVSMDAFVTAYKPAAVFFSCSVEMSYGNDELLITLARLHDTLLPSLQRGFRVILMGGDDSMVLNIAISLKMLAMRMVRFGWKLLDFCYLSDEVFGDFLTVPTISKMLPALVEDPVIRADILIQTFRDINVYALENKNRNTFLQNLDSSYHVMSRLNSLQNSGWILMEDEQLQYLSGIMVSSLKSTVRGPHVEPATIPRINEDTAIIDSKISQIKDLFPDYGKGFLAACLEVYNQNPEEVIQRILEGTLHEDLQCLDTTSDTMPTPKSTSTASKKDKGKGKLVESVPLPLTTFHSAKQVVAVEPRVESPSLSTSSTVGRFVRKANDLSDNFSLDTRPPNKDVAKALISQYEYEDEYDDSFDDLGFSVGESGLDNENLSDRIGTGSNFGKYTAAAKAEGSSQAASNAKWGSKKSPQFFVKDGKHYSYNVAGSVAVANVNDALLLTQAQGELIHGLGQGGNLPMGANRRLREHQEQELNDEPDTGAVEDPAHAGNGRGRGRRGRGGRVREHHGEQEMQGDGGVVEGQAEGGNFRGRGRGRGRGAANDRYRKNRAMSKHFSGISGV